jgi:hypothetical protein
MSANPRSMSGEFIPLASPVSSSTEAADGVQHLKVLSQDAARAVFEPLTGAATTAGPSTAPENCSKPTITLERKGDLVSNIRIQCGCGSVVELTCLH